MYFIVMFADTLQTLVLLLRRGRLSKHYFHLLPAFRRAGSFHSTTACVSSVFLDTQQKQPANETLWSIILIYKQLVFIRLC